MSKFDVTPEQQAALDAGATSTDPMVMRGAGGQRRRTYHNPVTGQEMISLGDPYHQTIREQMGWKLGPRPPELEEKWKIRQAELLAEDDAWEEAYAAAHPQQEGQQAQFNDAVTAAAEVAAKAILAKLGVDLPGETEVEAEAKFLAATSAPEEREGTQLSLDLPADAPPETEIKHVVSEASSPELHLVGHREEQT